MHIHRNVDENGNTYRREHRGSWTPLLIIPAMAISIPIIEKLGQAQGPLIYAVMGIALIGAVTVAMRYLMGQRHKLRLEEIEAKERMARAERDHLSAAERILELDRPDSLLRND
ncbi:MAG: hypothetical protein GEU79_08355 [Acidimicrobiia bacterium]|nr:hypothetical protein [Acidimicrobiia bacterium]